MHLQKVYLIKETILEDVILPTSSIRNKYAISITTSLKIMDIQIKITIPQTQDSI